MHHVSTPILDAIIPSNEGRQWPAMTVSDRLRRLAMLGASELHVWAGMKPKDGHDREPFTACAHPDCQLVRGDEL